MAQPPCPTPLQCSAAPASPGTPDSAVAVGTAHFAYYTKLMFSMCQLSVYKHHLHLVILDGGVGGDTLHIIMLIER